MRPLADYHTHTRWSHGSGTVADNLEAAAARGLKAVGIAEHGPNLLFLGVNRRRWPLLQQAIAKEDTQRTRLLFNAEANVVSLAGDIDLPAALVKNLDMLLISLHPRVVPAGLASWWAFYGLRWLSLLSQRRRHQLYEVFTEALVNCIRRQPAAILAHPGYRLPIDSRRLAQVSAEEGVRLEINCRHLAACAPDIARAAKETRVEFVISSDAHHPQEIGRFDEAARLALDLGISPERIINVDWQEKPW